MKHLLPLLALTFAGCQTPPVPEPTVAAAPPPVAPPILTPDPVTVETLRRQRQLVEALMSQNEALQAQLREVQEASTMPVAPAPVGKAEPPQIQPPPPIATPPPATEGITLLMPNADGVIDLVAAAALAAGESINPFVLRQPPAALPETVVEVQGVVRGETPCALVNNRVLTVGDQLDGLQLTRISPEALFFSINDFTLRIPVNGQPVHVRRS
jgi:hypothetical protein